MSDEHLTREDVEALVQEETADLEENIQQLQNEFLQPAVVEMVLIRAGLSDDRAEELVETMQDVQDGLGDSDV